MLNEMGYRARQGRLFQGTTLDYILKDSTAKGVRRANFTKNVDTPKHWEYKPESEWVFTECEPIVSEELWDRCNAILSRQQANRQPRARNPVHLFGGLTWCGVCGTKMYVKSNTPKYVCHKCCNQTRDLYGRWSELSHEGKSQVVQAIVERITIGKDEIEIQLYYLPTHPEPQDTPPTDPFHGNGSDEPHETDQSISPNKSAFRNSSKNVAKGSSIPEDPFSP